MKNKNTILALAAGIFFGGLAFFLLYQRASEIERKSTPLEILTAARYIPAGSLLEPGDVGKRTVPESFVNPGAISDLSEVAGLSSLAPFSAGEQILSNKFGAEENSLSTTLGPGYRAYTIEVSETSGVGHLLRPGNRVDILTKTDFKTKEVTSFVFQNIQVLAVGQKWDGRQKSRDGQESQGGAEPQPEPYGTVTLALTPDQAETMMYLEGHPLKLILRPPHDQEIVFVPSKTDSDVLAALGRPSPPSGGRKIEIIHGSAAKEE